MINTYLFDLDDTLISTSIYAEIYYPIIEIIKNKFNIDDEGLKNKAEELGLTLNKFNRWDTGDLCSKLGLLDEYYKVLENEIKVKTHLKNDIHELFNHLRKTNKKIGIVSNSMTRTIKAYLKRYNLDPDFIFSKDDANCKKNDITYWNTLINKFHLIPSDCIVIGDDKIQDILNPQKLGFKTFLVNDETNLLDLIN